MLFLVRFQIKPAPLQIPIDLLLLVEEFTVFGTIVAYIP